MKSVGLSLKKAKEIADNIEEELREIIHTNEMDKMIVYMLEEISHIERKNGKNMKKINSKIAINPLTNLVMY